MTTLDGFARPQSTLWTEIARGSHSRSNLDGYHVQVRQVLVVELIQDIGQGGNHVRKCRRFNRFRGYKQGSERRNYSAYSYQYSVISTRRLGSTEDVQHDCEDEQLVSVLFVSACHELYIYIRIGPATVSQNYGMTQC